MMKLLIISSDCRGHAASRRRLTNQPVTAAAEIVPTCMYCEKIQEADGAWRHREEAPERLANGARLSHGVCRECWDTVVKAQLQEVGVTALPEWDDVTRSAARKDRCSEQ